jgi:hypothetical protein
MSAIRSYDDLLDEKKRLETSIRLQKELIKEDIAMFREELKPARNALSAVGKIASAKRDNPLLRGGVEIASDIVLRSTFIAAGGWLTRLIAPLVVKNISNIFLSKKSGPVVSAWIGKLLHRSNGHR